MQTNSTNNIQSVSSPSNETSKPFSFTDNVITRVGGNIVKGITETLLFPTRYFGSKTWSLPGVVCRLPIVLFNRTFYASEREKPFQEQLFGTNTGYHFSLQKVLNQKETLSYLPAACMTATGYTLDSSWMDQLGYQIVKPESLQLDLKQISESLTCRSNFICHNSEGREMIGADCFFNESYGLKVMVAEKDNKVLINIGPRRTQDNPNLNFMGFMRYNVIGLLRYVSNLFFLAPLGTNPAIFDETTALIKLIKDHPRFEGKEITLCAHSVAGSFATYSGIQNKLPTVCFNSVPMGAGLQQKLGQEKLALADRYVTHITNNWDYCSDAFPPVVGIVDRIINFILGFKTAGNFGNRYTVPSAYLNPIHTHGFIIGSMMQHMGYDIRTKPDQISQEDKDLLNKKTS